MIIIFINIQLDPTCLVPAPRMGPSSGYGALSCDGLAEAKTTQPHDHRKLSESAPNVCGLNSLQLEENCASRTSFLEMNDMDRTWDRLLSPFPHIPLLRFLSY